MKRYVLAALLALGLSSAAFPQGTPGSGPNVITSSAYLGPVDAGSVTTRLANTTAYSANTILCGSVCAPFTVNFNSTNSARATVNRITFLKSGSSTTNANFTLWFFNAYPTLTGLSDGSAYVGPYAADIPHYLGNAQCTSGNATNDGTAQVWYECLVNSNNSQRTLEMAAPYGLGTVYGLISVTGAYTPASAETFQPFVTGVY